MTKWLVGCAGVLLLSSPIFAAEVYPVIDYSKVDARQYCIFEGKVYTRGIRVRTDTGTYTCRVASNEPGGNKKDNRGLLSWVREAI